MYQNPISGKLKRITLEDLFGLFDPEIHKQIQTLHDKPNALGLVVYENLQMDSSQFGARAVLVVGPGFSTPSIEIASKNRLGDVPSRFQYPTKYVAPDSIEE